MRVYLPTTLPGLARAHDAGSFGPGPLTAQAVTPALRDWYVSQDVEELEYAALVRAAQAALPLLAAEPDAPRRRVVVAVDVADGRVTADPDAGPGAVRVTEEIRPARAAAVHADEPDAEQDVAAAAAAWAAASRGDADAGFTVDGAEAHELLWYATQEIEDLLGR